MEAIAVASTSSRGVVGRFVTSPASSSWGWPAPRLICSKERRWNARIW